MAEGRVQDLPRRQALAHLFTPQHGNVAGEHLVPEHAGEDVPLLDLPFVELIEHLQEHGNVEDHGAVSLLIEAKYVKAAVLQC